MHTYVTGQPVTPGNFHGRAAECREFFERLRFQQMKPTRIIGLRQSGKTSFLLYVTERARSELEENTVVVYLDLQRMDSSFEGPERFWVEVAQEVGKRTAVTPPEHFTRFTKFAQWLEDEVLAKTRLAILLDEFDILHDSAEFKDSFFFNMRSLLNNPKFTWVTASRITDLQVDRDRAETYFFSSFDPLPIYTGALTVEEAGRLVRGPTEDQDWTDHGISELLRISGRIPYFVQVVADQWTREPGFSRPPDEVMKALLDPESQVSRNIHSIWRRLSQADQQTLKSVSTSSQSKINVDSARRLTRLGLLDGDGRRWAFNGELIRRWVKDQTPSDSTRNPTTKNAGTTGVDYDKDNLTRIIEEDSLRARRMLETILEKSPGLTPTIQFNFDRFDNDGSTVRRATEIWLADYCFGEHFATLKELRELVVDNSISSSRIKEAQKLLSTRSLHRQSTFHREAILNSQVYEYLKVLLPPVFETEKRSARQTRMSSSSPSTERDDLVQALQNSPLNEEFKSRLIDQVESGQVDRSFVEGVIRDYS